MYITRKTQDFIVTESESILSTLGKIRERKGRIVFVLNEKNILKGVVTNGDILRWLVENPTPDLTSSISNIANRNFIFANQGEDKLLLRRKLKKVMFVPILNDQMQLISVASREEPREGIEIGEHLVGGNARCFVIAEIGNNHNGDIQLAKRLVDECISAGVDCAKFQMRNLEKLYANAGDTNDSRENLGSQYTLDLLSRFQLSDESLFEVFDYCKERGIMPLCTPWDLDSLAKLETYGMQAYKIASADLTNHELIKAVVRTGKPVICSSGMSSEDEVVETVSLLKNEGTPFVLLHCNSTYPTPFSDINLSYLSRMKETFKCNIGYSGHERGISVSIAAVALGAKVIERHITLDTTMEGSDHKASLLPGQFQEMVQGIREVELAMGTDEIRVISQGEMMNRTNLAKSLVINQDLSKGQVIKSSMIDVKSPGRGIQPNQRDKLIGNIAVRDMKKGDFFYPGDLINESVTGRAYSFKRPWGIPVRYHDFAKIVEEINPSLVEFHLSYKDLEESFEKYFDGTYDIDFVVHCPELFANDHTLDLTSENEEYRKKSLGYLQEVINITRKISAFFPRTKKPLIVTNVGGFSSNGFISDDVKSRKLKLLAESLKEVDESGVEIIPQTMPPFPWHFGGQQYHNLFVESEEIVAFCLEQNRRICLDISHSMLAASHYGWSLYEFVEKTAPYTAHLHIADAENTGGEGLQIGEGEIDFYACAKLLDQLAPKASFIPEIWQGHENNGEGFWIALNRLEKIF